MPVVLEVEPATKGRGGVASDDSSDDRRATRESRREAKLAARRRRAEAKQAAAQTRAAARAAAAAAKAAEQVDFETAGQSSPEIGNAAAGTRPSEESPVAPTVGGPAVQSEDHTPDDDVLFGSGRGRVEQPLHEEPAEEVLADEPSRPSELEAPLAHALARAAQFERERELEAERQAVAEREQHAAAAEVKAEQSRARERAQAKAARRDAKAAQRQDKQRPTKQRRADDDHIVEAPREPRVPLRERLLQRRGDGRDRPSSKAPTAAKGDRIVSALAGMIGALGLICSVVLAFGALLVALDATSSSVYDTVSSVCDVLVGPARDIVSFSGTNAAMKEALVAWGAGAIVYLVVGIGAQTVLRSRLDD